MGIIPDTTYFGDDCLTCYPAGETPNLLKVFFSGIQKGDAWDPVFGLPPNGYFDLLQDPDHPCEYYDKLATWPFIHLEYLVNRTDLQMSVRTGIFAFAQTIGPICADFLRSEFHDPQFVPFFGGQAFITTPAKMAEMIKLVTPMIDPDPRMECFPCADEQIVLRYAGKRDATNVYILFDTDA